MIVVYSFEHSMPGPSTVEQMEKAMEVSKTKHGTLQKEKAKLPPGLDISVQNLCKRCTNQYFQTSDAALQHYINISVCLKLLYFMSFMLLSRHLQNALSFPHTNNHKGDQKRTFPLYSQPQTLIR